MRLSPNKTTYLLAIAALLLTTAVYWPGLSGAFVFDDYPNIVDNEGVQPKTASFSALVRAALSSPSSDFGRPIASLSFAINYLISGLNPYGMKLTNLAIHLLNGLLTFLLARALLCSAEDEDSEGNLPNSMRAISLRTNRIAILIAASWLILPINLTAVLYIVQRMESLANLFVLLGLIGYVSGRRRMLRSMSTVSASYPLVTTNSLSLLDRNFVLCVVSIAIPTAIGVLAKETAIMLPLYALSIEWVLFKFRYTPTEGAINEKQLHALATNSRIEDPITKKQNDWRIQALFLAVLALPLVIGLFWLIPKVLSPQAWITRDFSLHTRLLSETRIIISYIRWTLLPAPHALSFYHDDFVVSSQLLIPWTTLACTLLLAALIVIAIWLRPRRPLVALGVLLFLSCHLLTGTLLPLELIYEHRNYFASFGLLLVVIPLLAAPTRYKTAINSSNDRRSHQSRTGLSYAPFARSRHLLLAGLFLCWTLLTAYTAYAWGNPLRLAIDLASRAPESPRAQYELGRTYIILSHYDPDSPFTNLAYAPLERAAALPKSSILPEQALIFMNARMRLPLKDAWWSSLVAKLGARPPTVQDESSLASLTLCSREHSCELPTGRMEEAFKAALSHPNPSARLLANYGDYAWNVLTNHQVGLQMFESAVSRAPNEPAYRVTLARALITLDMYGKAQEQIEALQRLNYGGRLNGDLAALRMLIRPKLY